MRLLLADHLEAAMTSLRVNRSRSILTILGIVIGVASITAILSLAGGVTSVVNKQISEVGGNIAVVRPGVENSSVFSQLSQSVNPTHYSTSTLSEEDLDVLSNENKNLDIAPIMTISASLTAGNNKIGSATILATNPALEKTTKLPIDEGQFIDSTTSDNTAVVGSQLAVDLFGTSSPLGQTFTLHKQTFTVIGVLKKYNNPFNYDGINFDNSMIIDINAGKLLHRGQAQIQQFTIRAPSTGELEKALPKLTSTLEARHGDKDFSVVAGKDIARPTNSLFLILASVMSAIAAISLVVGGIGVMNIMLVGVAERTREIGIRKAVGASNKMIVSQFMIEALLMSLAGGILGLTLGVVVAFTIGAGLYFTPIITWQIGIIALLTSLVVGVVFGLYPAIRASRKDPIESLRQYR